MYQIIIDRDNVCMGDEIKYIENNIELADILGDDSEKKICFEYYAQEELSC